MPCYCDVPDEDGQKKIESRCKVKMYFDVQYRMTIAEVEKAEKMKISKYLLKNGDENEKLCRLCSILSKETMEKVDAFYYQIKWPHKTLYDWYMQHCKDDIIESTDI